MGFVSENKTSVLILNCSTCHYPVNLSRAVALGIVLGFFILFAILGNILVILSVACHRHLQTVTNYFIVNLAIADLLLSCTVLPFSATLEILRHWAFGRVFCNVWAAMDVLCSTASIMSLCVISIDRYIGVSYPVRHPTIMTERRGLLTLVVVWLLALVISIGPLFGWKEPAPKDETICKVTEEPGYVLFSAFGSFYVPLTIILIMYCRVYIVAKRETRSLKAGKKRERSQADEVTLRIHRKNARPESSPRPSELNPRTKGTQFKTHFSVLLLKFSREKKAAKTLGIVVGGFILCWLPFFVVLPLGSFFPSYKPPETIFKIAFWLGYFNSCINPIIYPASNQEFKKAFQNILKGHCRHRKQASINPPLSYSIDSNHSAQGHNDLVRIPLGTREAFFKISKSDGVCEWKLFSTLPERGTKGNCRSPSGKDTTILRCCCADARAPDGDAPSAPNLKLHASSAGDSGDPV
ncbi:adrenoceptor alpha 1Aa [Carcharodon carcharias]|uniref:adrenoceptor alpha 1Aa n=1 Tax=Carcharodon carcharias TaxID=13397 RepID=UPI001B7E9F3E|nr:adrenoceptor alpha 1Aa [Carcharodon carcharias]